MDGETKTKRGILQFRTHIHSKAEKPLASRGQINMDGQFLVGSDRVFVVSVQTSADRPNRPNWHLKAGKGI